MNNELYHYGVKGMKWGVRRYQNKNGSLTDVGKKRYSDESEQTKKKLTTQQKVALGIAVTVGVLAIYGGYKLSNSRYIDRTIRVGKKFYRQGSKNESIEGLNELVYATFKKSDSNKYAKISPGSIKYTITNSNKTKVAGVRNAERIYKETLANNEQFRSRYGHMSYKDFNGSLGYANKMIIEQNKLYDKKLSDMYVAPFFKALSEKGYNAIVDTQDAFAKVPVLLINSNNDYQIVS